MISVRLFEIKKEKALARLVATFVLVFFISGFKVTRFLIRLSRDYYDSPGIEQKKE